MRQLKSAFCLILAACTAFFLMFSFTIVIHESSSNEFAKASITFVDHKVKPMIRKPASGAGKLKAASKQVLVFVLIPLLLILRLPRIYLPFESYISKLKRQLLMLPVKYTSFFVAGSISSSHHGRKRMYVL